MNPTRCTTSLALILAGVLFLGAPALAQSWCGGRGGGPRWQQTQDTPGPGPGYRQSPNYPRYQNCPWGNTPQGPRGPRLTSRGSTPTPPATPPAVNP